jgi:putative salt-induced outer membrane protein YdiY
MTSSLPSRKVVRRLGGGILCGILFSVTAWAQPVVLHLRNGDRVTGTITAENLTTVVLTTPWAKEITVPAALILKQELLVPPPPQVAAAPAATNVNVARVVPTTNAPVKPKPPKHWTGEVQLGTDLGFSEVNRQLYYGRVKLAYSFDQLRNFFDYQFTYGKSDGTLSANRMDGSAKTDFDLSRHVYLYNLAGGGYDEVRKIDLRLEIGPGVGYHLIKLTNFVLNTEGGINYQEQHFSDDTQKESLYFRLAENAAFNIGTRFTWDEKFEFFPRIENWGEYRFRFETNLRYWLKTYLSINLTLLDLYDTKPAQNVDQNDLQVRSSLGVKF